MEKGLTATAERVRGTHVYLGLKACGCGVAVVIDDEMAREDLAETLAGYIREGLTIERVPIDGFMSRFKGCKCESPKQG